MVKAKLKQISKFLIFLAVISTVVAASAILLYSTFYKRPRVKAVSSRDIVVSVEWSRRVFGVRLFKFFDLFSKTNDAGNEIAIAFGTRLGQSGTYPIFSDGSAIHFRNKAGVVYEFDFSNGKAVQKFEAPLGISGDYCHCDGSWVIHGVSLPDKILGRKQDGSEMTIIAGKPGLHNLILDCYENRVLIYQYDVLERENGSRIFEVEIGFNSILEWMRFEKDSEKTVVDASLRMRELLLIEGSEVVLIKDGKLRNLVFPGTSDRIILGREEFYVIEGNRVMVFDKNTMNLNVEIERDYPVWDVHELSMNKGAK
jgi:hypothetical protein